MGGKSSSTQQSTQQVDSRQVNTRTDYNNWSTTNNNDNRSSYDMKDDHSVSLGSGALFATGGSSIHVTDAGAVRGALDLADNLSSQAFKTTGGVVTDAFSFGSDLASYFGKAINANAGRSLDSVDSAVSGANALAGKALNFADSSQSNAFDFGAQLAKLFGTQINSSSSRAFDSVDSAVSALQSGNKAALNTVDSVTGNAFDFGAQLAKLFGTQINSSAGRALDTVDSAIKSNSDTTKGAFNLVDSVTSTLSRDNASTAQALGRQAFDTADSLSSTFANALAGTTDKATRGLLDAVSGLASGEQSFLANVLGQQSKSTDKVTELVANAYNDAKGRGAMTDTLMLVAIGGAVAVAIFALQRRG